MWDEWVSGVCSVTCGTGTEVRTRTKLVEEDFGGTCTGQNHEIVTCDMDPCPSKKLYPYNVKFKL